MIFIFRNKTIFWDISKWNRGQKKWDGGSSLLECNIIMQYCILSPFLSPSKKKKKKKVL